jgi:hypothetical protein
MRFFSASALRNSTSRVFYIFLISFSAVFAIFSRTAFSRAAVRSTFFLIFFFAASRAFFSRAIACCSFLSAVIRFYWNSIFFSADARFRA